MTDSVAGMENICDACLVSFASRNLLFRHLRQNSECAARCEFSEAPRPKKGIFLIGYSGKPIGGGEGGNFDAAVHLLRALGYDPSLLVDCRNMSDLGRSVRGFSITSSGLSRGGGNPFLVCQPEAVHAVCDVVTASSFSVPDETLRAQLQQNVPEWMQIVGCCENPKSLSAERHCELRRYDIVIPESALHSTSMGGWGDSQQLTFFKRLKNVSCCFD